tara:strand:+ start:147 stop:437 length:291 start_codon:yes stop_codon:yes gene_type:complete
MKVLKNFENKLCNRMEYEIELVHDKEKTPTKEDIKKKLATLFKTKEELIALKGIYTKYGYSKSKISAYAYSDDKSFKNFEVKNHGKKKKTKKQGSK